MGYSKKMLFFGKSPFLSSCQAFFFAHILLLKHLFQISDNSYTVQESYILYDKRRKSCTLIVI